MFLKRRESPIPIDYEWVISEFLSNVEVFGIALKNHPFTNTNEFGITRPERSPPLASVRDCLNTRCKSLS